jgi:hypothetical protein
LKNKFKQERVKKNKKLHVFFIFLGLSTILWTMSKLSKEYTHTVAVKTNYINFTRDKELYNKPVDHLELVLKATGFSLLGYSVFDKKIAIDLTKLYKNKKLYYFLTNENLSSLQSQLPPDETLLRVYPDTLFFDFGKLTSKQIEVIPKISISYKTGYNLLGNLEIEPNTVLISGTDEQINKISKINTVPKQIKDVSDDFEYKLALDIPKEYNRINFSTKEITIKGVVEKYTEATLDIPFQLINVPKDYNIKTFVETVKVTYKVSLDNYEKIQAADFKVICDYNKIKDIDNNFLMPELVKKSNLVSNIKLNPKKIEFLIKK